MPISPLPLLALWLALVLSAQGTQGAVAVPAGPPTAPARYAGQELFEVVQ